jgi:hypothetical protein
VSSSLTRQVSSSPYSLLASSTERSSFNLNDGCRYTNGDDLASFLMPEQLHQEANCDDAYGARSTISSKPTEREPFGATTCRPSALHLASSNARTGASNSNLLGDLL